jgi:exonuclease SbcC
VAATRQTLENILSALSLTAPEEGAEAAWLAERERELSAWQENKPAQRASGAY